MSNQQKKNKTTQAEFLQQGALYEAPDEVLLQTAGTRIKKKSNKKLIIIIASIFVVLLILILLLLVKMRSNRPVVEDEEEEVIEEVQKELSPLAKQLREVKQELDLADPSSKKVPFPQVNMDIRIEAEYDD